MSSRSHKALEFVSITSILLLGGCTDLSVGNDLQSIYKLMGGAIHTHTISLEEAAATPYASMGVRIGDGSEFMVVLATDVNGVQLWTSTARIALTSSGGRIIRTAGLYRDLAGFENLSEKLNGDGLNDDIRWTADFPDIGLYAVSISCKRHNTGEEIIEILGKAIRTRRIEESCASQSFNLNWRFRNIYWQSLQNGFVWRSIQHTHPRLDALEIEILRPPTQ